MKILLDTCALSELSKPHANQSVQNALESFFAENLFISVITLGEITKGINLLPTSKRKTDLINWATKIENAYSSQILYITPDIAHRWGELTAKTQKQGKIIRMADGLIAATALTHNLYIMTRNTADFKLTGTLLINPWQADS